MGPCQDHRILPDELATASFERYGSLYYRSNLEQQDSSEGDATHETVPLSDARFTIGPTTGRDWNDDGRLFLDFDRGPCEFLQIMQPTDD